MKLQIALDVIDEKKALGIAKKVSKYVDIIEIGTPLIKEEELNLIKKFKKFRKPIVADLKTMDTGSFEAGMAFKAGASITTVCASADDSTIKGAIKASRKYKKKVLVDLIAIKSKNINKRVKEILKLKPDYICVHTGIDMQNEGKNPLINLKKVSKLVNGKKTKIAVAGGINLKTIDEIKKYNPEIIIVGGAITKAKNPDKIAKELKEAIKND